MVGKYWVAAVLLLALGVAGCGGMRDLPIVGYADPKLPGEYSTAAAKEMFEVGYENIDKVYLEPLPLSKVALDGLKAVSSLDPEFRVERVGGDIRIAEGTQVAARFIAPADHDSKGWAAVLAGALEAGRAKSDKLRGTSVETLYQTVLDGSLHDLDRFSRYAGAAAAQDNRASRDGFGGVGIELQTGDDGMRVAAVLPDTPAAEAGLRPGDGITHIDGKPIAGMSEHAVTSMIRGPEGTTVNVTVVRDTKPTFTVSLRRAVIIVPTITYRREANDIAYFQISGFNARTEDALHDAVLRAKAEIGPQLRGAVLDLRNNPGGYLDQGVGIADLFVTSGRILTTRGRDPESTHLYDATQEGDLLGGLPLVVLINGGSASSSEIVAAALQDLGRAVVIGTSSYGKGTVQLLVKMPNGGELILTWAKLYAPSGYALQRLGVIPNICTSGKSVSAAKAIADLRGGAFDPVAPVFERRKVDASSEREQLALAATCPSETGTKSGDDVDLQVARGVLADPALVSRSLRGASVAAAR